MNDYPICPKCFTRDRKFNKQEKYRKCYWCNKKYDAAAAEKVKHGIEISRGANN